ncbi:hypothetical protein ILUMI_21360, partial [Ignelater luminosus]
LSDETFLNLLYLMYLHLQNNKLSNVPIGCFRDLIHLRMLDLSGNQIDELEYGTFTGLDNLETLNISNNRLSYLYESSFHNLKNLDSLSIGNNLITSFDPHDLLEYSNLSTISIDNNLWNCKSLLNIALEFEKRNVKILRGSTVKSENIRGIACSNNKLDSNYFANVKENHSLDNLSTKLNSLREFFDKDFINSSFYKFFENFRELTPINKMNSPNITNDMLLRFLNSTFNNAAFHQLLNKSSSTLDGFYSLEKAVSKLTYELNLINISIKNLSLSNQNSPNVTQYFSKYFERDFKNSSFYKYFNKDFDNSKLVKHFNATFPNQFDISLSKIQNYFDADFKNSSFYQLFNNLNWNKPDSEAAYFSGLTSNLNSLDEAELLTKLSELSNNLKLQQDIMQSTKTGNTVFMAIIIILLLAITFLFSFNYVKVGFKRTVNRASYETTNDSRINITNAELELI